MTSCETKKRKVRGKKLEEEEEEIGKDGRKEGEKEEENKKKPEREKKPEKEKVMQIENKEVYDA